MEAIPGIPKTIPITRLPAGVRDAKIIHGPVKNAISDAFIFVLFSSFISVAIKVSSSVLSFLSVSGFRSGLKQG